MFTLDFVNTVAFAGVAGPGVALSLFLVLALMTLRLWELANVALPMLVILPLRSH